MDRSANSEPTAGPALPLSRQDRAYAELKSRIKTNRYPPGFTALEKELAEELGVSRTPVREALIRLQEEGYVEIRPRHGMRVLSLSPNDMTEIYEVISGLEATAVLLLTRTGLKPDEAKALDAAVSAMEAAIAAGDLDAWAAADGDFHHALFDFCGNSRLRSLGHWHLERTERARHFTLRLRQKPSVSTADHRDLVELIAKGAEEEAQAAVIRHRMRAMKELVAIIARHHLVGV
ncbi:MAG: GntR family transcriptional regulator [Paracoccaceae bacterium]